MGEGRGVSGSEAVKHKWGGEGRRDRSNSTEGEGAGVQAAAMLPVGKGQRWRLAAILAPSGPEGASFVGHVCSPRPRPVREELDWGGRPDCRRAGAQENRVDARGARDWDRRSRLRKVGPASTCARSGQVFCGSAGLLVARSPVPAKAPSGRALTVRVIPLGSLPVVHPTEPLEVVIVAAPRPVHRHHGKVRHRTLSALPLPLPRLPAPKSPPPGAGAPRPLAFFPAALTSSARPPGRPSGAGSRRGWAGSSPRGPRGVKPLWSGCN